MNALKKLACLYSAKSFQTKLEEFRQAYYALQYDMDEEWREYLHPLVIGDWKDPYELIEFIEKEHEPRPDYPLEMDHRVVITVDGRCWDSLEYSTKLSELLNKL